MNIFSLLSGSVPMLDFDIYFQTAKDVFGGAHPLKLPYMQTGGPPSVILPFLMLTWMPLAYARSVMTLLSLMSVFASGWVLVSKYFVNKKIFVWTIFVLLFFLAFPTRFNLGQGQPNLILMWMVCLLLFGDKKAASCWIALMMLLKTNYALLLFARTGKNLIISFSIFVCFLILGFVVVKPEYYADYINQRALNTFVSSGDGGFDYYNQSLRSTLSKIGLSAEYQMVYLLSLVGGVLYLIKTKDLMGGVILSLLLSPILWQHYVVVAYPVVVGLVLEKNAKIVKILAIIGGMMLVFNLDFLHSVNQNLANGLLASHFFFGLMLVFWACFSKYMIDMNNIHKTEKRVTDS